LSTNAAFFRISRDAAIPPAEQLLLQLQRELATIRTELERLAHEHTLKPPNLVMPPKAVPKPERRRKPRP
jgi:hypothetical protein